MSNSNFRSLQADYVSGINADRNYIKNGLALQGTAGWVSTRRVIEGVTDGTSETFITSSSANPYSFTAGEPLIAFSNLGGLTNGTTYYARDNASDTTLASSVGGAALNLSTLFNTVAVSPNFFGFYSGNSISTWSVTTSAPLKGDSSFLLTKPASLAVGDAHYYPFTIDNADQARVMQLTFDYSVSGTYVTGDVVVRIRDVTNNRIIQPSGFQVENVGVASEARLTFQTSADSTSYELIFNIASVSTAAYTLKIDNISIGSQIVPIAQMRGPIGSIIYLGTATAPGGYIAANGAAVSRTTYAKLFSVIGTTFGSGDGSTTFNVPDLRGIFIRGAGSQVIGSETYTGVLGTKQNDNFQAHSHNVTDASGNQQSINNVPTGSATGPIPRGSTFNTTSNLITSTAGSGTETYPANISLHGYICFDEGSTILSSSADTRVVAASMNRATNQTGVNPNNSAVKINFNGILNSVNTHGNADTTNFRINISVPGTYKIEAGAFVSGTNVLANYYGLQLYKNGSSVGNLDYKLMTVTTDFVLQGVYTLPLVAGDYLEIYLQGVGNNSVSTLTVAASSLTKFTATMLQGPSQIAASEVIACRYTAPSAGSFSAETTIVYGTRDYDTHSAYNNVSGTYTAPAPGYYEISGFYLTNSVAQGTTGAVQIGYSKNGGARVRTGWTLGSGGNINQFCQGTDVVYLNAGDTIVMKANSSSTTTMDSGVLTIRRLGGVM